MPVKDGKKVIFSGMQPSGVPSLGNYLGALKNWALLQEEYYCLYCVVDLHAITLRQDPAQLRKDARNLLMLYLAAGLDPEKNLIYYQSHVPQHAQLSWILNCYTYMGELSRMTQFKEKSQRHEENINAGLFTYPVLMAADILLFQADLVPVGEDQRQHLELCRDIAIRFNNLYGEVFTVPEAFVGKTGARVMSLQNPERKMSKSEDESSVIFLLDEPSVIMNKIKRAVTDSGNEVRHSPDKPGISNLLDIYCAITRQSLEQAESFFENMGYGRFKAEVGEAVVEELRPVREKFQELSKNKDYIDGLIRDNGEKARGFAGRTLQKVHKKIGLPL